MAQEIEIKQRLDDPDATRRRLRSCAAQRTARVLEINQIFDTRDRRLRAADCGLRLRVCHPEGGPGAVAATLAYKGPRQARPTKTREELETTVADAPATSDILRRLGFTTVIVYEKRREIWQLDDCEVCLDELPRVGWFVEIEGPSPAAIEAVRRRLGLSHRPPLSQTYAEMAAASGDLGPEGLRRLQFEETSER